MAGNPRGPRSFVRRAVVFGTLVMACVGLLALEHTATGATTGTPSHAYNTNTHHVTTTTAKHHNGDPGDHRRCDDEHGQHREHEEHCRAPSGAPHH